MARVKPMETTKAEGRARELLEKIELEVGMAPNVLRTMAHSPAVLEAYLAFSGALKRGSLDGKLRECIALSVGESNDCGYCVAAHSAMGRTAGLTKEEILDCRRGKAGDGRTQAALDFTKQILEKRGWVDDNDMKQVREAEFTDGEIVEIVAVVALNLFTNYFNHAMETKLDFPKVPDL